jgi:tRNA A37 threonylcarbamoyladenosine biosynthesis protein TsaE
LPLQTQARTFTAAAGKKKTQFCPYIFFLKRFPRKCHLFHFGTYVCRNWHNLKDVTGHQFEVLLDGVYLIEQVFKMQNLMAKKSLAVKEKNSKDNEKKKERNQKERERERERER